ncbi:cation channel sperm-associated protein 1-like [Mobula birostris]|uniref:cation channel sperm-associated protein 1-like n=1 Tax=Mobula birostris TaxID=1983395 RepID=UPI003B285B89
MDDPVHGQMDDPIQGQTGGPIQGTYPRERRRSDHVEGYRQKLDRCCSFLRNTFKDFIEFPVVGSFILATVLINVAMLVSQTYMSVIVRGGWFLSAMDSVFMAVYISEYILKVFVWRRNFFKNFWNDLDLAIVCLTLLVLVVSLLQPAGTSRNTRQFTVFRILRICKLAQAMQVFHIFKHNRFLINIRTIFLTCLRSLHSMGTVILLMLTLTVVFSIMFRDLFAEADPARFGDMYSTIYTLFQLLTLDDWTVVYMASKEAGYWHISIFLVFYIFVEHFIFFTLFIAILVDNFQLIIKQQNEAKKRKESLDKKNSLLDEFTDAADKEGEMDSAREDNEMFLMRIIDEHYSSHTHAAGEKMLIFYCFQLLGAIEHQLYLFQMQNTMLNETVDCFFEVQPSSVRNAEDSLGQGISKRGRFQTAARSRRLRGHEVETWVHRDRVISPTPPTHSAFARNSK